MGDYNKSIVEKIKQIRQQKSISQQAIADALNLTVTAYNRIENNKTQLTVNNLYTISNFLEVTVAELIGLIPGTILHNKNNLVMSQFNNGELQITVNTKELDDLLKVFKTD